MGLCYSVSMPNDPRSLTTRRFVYILLVWNNTQPEQLAASRGYLESISGERHYFHTLSELNALLIHLAGWVEPASDPSDV